MPNSFPTNTVILITTGVIGVSIVIWFMLSEVLSKLPFAPHVKRNWRWGVGIVLGLWLLVRLILEIFPPNGELIGTVGTVGFVAFGLFIGTFPLLISPTFRQIIRATPATWVIALHAVRIEGGLFLALNDMKLLPSNFALPAGYGDVGVAVLSLVVVYLLATNNPYARRIAIVWNIIGIIDLVNALATGTIYIAPFVAQLARTGTPVLYLNYVLIIPAYGVPLVGIFHVYSLFQLFSRRADITKHDVDVPLQVPVTAERP
jgi:hypothetical protein